MANSGPPEPPFRFEFEMSSDTSSAQNWECFGKQIPKTEITYFSQIVLIFIIVIASLINISLGSKDTTLWITLLSSSVGYCLPQPKLKYNGNAGRISEK